MEEVEQVETEEEEGKGRFKRSEGKYSRVGGLFHHTYHSRLLKPKGCLHYKQTEHQQKRTAFSPERQSQAWQNLSQPLHKQLYLSSKQEWLFSFSKQRPAFPPSGAPKICWQWCIKVRGEEH